MSNCTDPWHKQDRCATCGLEDTGYDRGYREASALDVERLARAFYNVTQGRFAVSDLMPSLPDWRDPSIDSAVWDKAVADGAEVAREYAALDLTSGVSSTQHG